MPLVYALLPDKTEKAYTYLLQRLHHEALQINLQFSPQEVMLDFEVSALNAFATNFPTAKLSCCRFHFGQALWRKIMELGLASDFKDAKCEISKWLKHFFGLPMLEAYDVEAAFTEDIMSEAPQDSPCENFSDYVLAT